MPEQDTRYLLRLSPRLRMIANGNSEVNTYRAQLSGSVRTTDPQVKLYRPLEKLEAAEQHDPSRTLGDPPDLVVSRAIEVSCFVHHEDPNRPSRRIGDSIPQRGQVGVADLRIERVETLARLAVDEHIAYIETGSPISLVRPLDTTRFSPAPVRRSPLSAHTPQQPVLIGLIDVGGFDFSHPDFLVDGKTRFHSIWDQGAVNTGGTGRVPFGRELTRAEMNAAIDQADDAGVAPDDLLPQSTQHDGSHGTHVASIAGGNSGVFPAAHLAGVLLALSDEELDRHATFADSTRLVHAVDYLFDLSAQLDNCPVVVNISLGTNGHAHDGTSPVSRWIDSALALPGRCVTVAAGNAGQEAPGFEGDLGYLAGRIHSSGRIAARGLSVDLEWQVVGNGIVDISENEMEIWCEAGDEFSVTLFSPSGDRLGPVGPGDFIENKRLPSDTFVSIYNERYHPANGANRISLFLSPRLLDEIVGIESGTWTVRLTGDEVRDGRFDAWIERDDARPIGRRGEQQAWRFPSFFSARSNVDRSSVSSLACGRDIIAVGNSDTANETINPSSSQGPTRDGRPNPDIAAPGTGIVAARGFAGRDERQLWMTMTGTSMASPYVAGVAAHMLATQPHLTSSQIAGIMRHTARPLPGVDYHWQDDAGYGEIQPTKCVEQATKAFDVRDLTHQENET